MPQPNLFNFFDFANVPWAPPPRNEIPLPPTVGGTYHPASSNELNFAAPVWQASIL